MLNNRRRLTAGLIALGFTIAAAAMQDSSGQAEPAASAARGQTAVDGSVDRPGEAASPRSDEGPLEAAPGGQTLLEYEPTEAISEDRSVSFPVDI